MQACSARDTGMRYKVLRMKGWRCGGHRMLECRNAGMMCRDARMPGSRMHAYSAGMQECRDARMQCRDAGMPGCRDAVPGYRDAGCRDAGMWGRRDAVPGYSGSSARQAAAGQGQGATCRAPVTHCGRQHCTRATAAPGAARPRATLQPRAGGVQGKAACSWGARAATALTPFCSSVVVMRMQNPSRLCQGFQAPRAGGSLGCPTK